MIAFVPKQMLHYSSPPSYKATPFAITGFIRGVASLERDNLVAFYILGVSEIWPDKRDGLWWKGSYKKGD